MNHHFLYQVNVRILLTSMVFLFFVDRPCQSAVLAGPDEDCLYAERGATAYWFCHDNRDFATARSYCAKVDMDLARVDDAAENRFIHDHIGFDSWIGATDENAEGNWRWVDDGTVFWSGGPDGDVVGLSYANWACVST
jgi:hypothetical protein